MGHCLSLFHYVCKSCDMKFIICLWFFCLLTEELTKVTSPESTEKKTVSNYKAYLTREGPKHCGAKELPEVWLFYY